MNIAYNMDCMEYMRALPDKAFELAIVDPVYGDVGKGGYMRNKSSGGVAAHKEYNTALWKQPKTGPEYFQELFRVSKNQIIFGANYFPAEIGKPSQGWIIWDKCHPEGLKFADCEIAFSSFDIAARIFKYKWNGMLQENMSNKEIRIHPTQKPVALYSWILQRYAKPGDKILDTHLGSGSSRIAAYDLGFDFVGLEIDVDYFKAQEARYLNHTSQGNLFIDNPTVTQA